MIPVRDAEVIVLDLALSLDPQRDSEAIPLADATDRVLADPIASPLDFPHWDNSAMDGYAIRFEDVAESSADRPVMLDVIEMVPAGRLPQKTVGPGQATRLFTGSMMPAGADTIAIQEEVERDGDRLRITLAPSSGAFVRKQGAFCRTGDILLEGGRRLGPAEVAVLAAAQCPQVSVYRRPRVAILSTGDELVPVDRPLQPGQIVDSNQYALTAFVRQQGCEAIPLGIVRDDPELLKATISRAIATADVVLSTGGVSVGDYDFVESLLVSLGGEIAIHAVAIKPGKPLTVARFATPVGDRPSLYFGLPGNPASALVTCWRFVAPVLRKMSGLPGPFAAQFLSCKTRSPLTGAGKRETYLWGNLAIAHGQYEFVLSGGSHNSANLTNLVGTTALAVVPIGEKQLPAGATVRVLPVGSGCG